MTRISRTWTNGLKVTTEGLAAVAEVQHADRLPERGLTDRAGREIGPLQRQIKGKWYARESN